MKKFVLLFLSFIVLSLFLNGCQQQASNEKKAKSLDVREAVWKQLTENDKKHIKGTWKDATVRKIVLTETMGNVKDKSYIGKEVYLVDYPSNDNLTLGGVVVYADLRTFKLIGYGYRD